MLNKEIKLEGIIRDGLGKGYARKLRKNGNVPAVVYSNAKESISFSIVSREIEKILLGSMRRNSLISLELKKSSKLDYKIKKVMIKDLQIDLVMRTLKHIDFIEIDFKKHISAMVPVVPFGKCKSVIAGGNLEQVRKKIMIKCLPEFIPEKILFDVTDMPFGSTCSDQIILPKYVELLEENSSPLITIKYPRKSKSEVKDEPKDDESKKIDK